MTGLTRFLLENHDTVTEFTFRLYKKLLTLPLLSITEKQVDNPKDYVATGSFMGNGSQWFFQIQPSVLPVEHVLHIDESALVNRIELRGDRYVIDVEEKDDVFVTWNAISKTHNLRVFSELGVTKPGGQTWLTGQTFKDLSFLRTRPATLGNSVAFQRLSERCIKHDMYYDEAIVGDKTIVYA
jgi:hypothetical protein